MECYHDAPVISELIKAVSFDTNITAIHAMTSAIINYYLPVEEGYIISTDTSPPDNDADSLMLTVQRFLSADEGLRDIIIIEMRPNLVDGRPPLDRLVNSLTAANNGKGSCFGILIIGPMMLIFEYCSGKLCAWTPPGYEVKNNHDFRSDVMSIHWFFKRAVRMSEVERTR